MSSIGESWRNTDPIIDEFITARLDVGNDDSFYVYNVDDVQRKVKFWNEKFPRVQAFYAMKAADSDFAIRTMAKLGTGFDCASKTEINRILALNVHPDKIIYSNPVKQVSHLRYARENGIDKMTFDSIDELHKIKEVYPEAKVVLRIRFDAKKVSLLLGSKFGCDPRTEAPELIRQCKKMEINLIGISFHVGCDHKDPQVYGAAIRTIKQLFDFAHSIDTKLNFVDIGGGFSGIDMKQVEDCAEIINEAVDECFPDPGVQVISEPGLFFMQSAMKLLCCVSSRRVQRDDDGNVLHVNYFINNGIYTSFLYHILLKIPMSARAFRTRRVNGFTIKSFESTFWGQSCDSTDKLFEVEIQELQVGDWIIFDQSSGAYGHCRGTEFNGFPKAEIIPLDKIKHDQFLN